MATAMRRVKVEDIELARLYMTEHPELSREHLGRFLEKDGLGIGHHTHGSGCADRVEYINVILDHIMPEDDACPAINWPGPSSSVDHALPSISFGQPLSTSDHTLTSINFGRPLA